MMRWKLVLSTMLMLGFSPLVAEEMVSQETSGTESKSSLSAETKIGTGLENRQVVGEADTFPADTVQLVGWTRISGANEPTQITHVWKLNGAVVGAVPLSVASSPYRTNSRKTVIGSGTYTLEVKDADGNMIASKEVSVQAPVQ